MPKDRSSGPAPAAQPSAGAAAADPRFAAAYSDPRFQRFPTRKKAVNIDERFAGELSANCAYVTGPCTCAEGLNIQGARCRHV